MTDNEIITALECCFTNEDCSLCPLFRKCPTSFKLEQYALDLINRQQADIRKLQLENEKLEIKLKGKVESLNKSTNSAMEVIKKQDAEIERLEAKAEAIKEFAEKLKINYSKPLFAVGSYNEFIREVDNLVKEMVGEE